MRKLITNDFKGTSLQFNRWKSALHTFVGGISTNFLNLLQMLIVLPVLIKTIEPKVYGIWIGSADLLLWVSYIMIGFSVVMAQRISVFHAKHNYKDLAEYFATTIIGYFIFFLILIFISPLLSRYIYSFFDLSNNDKKLLSSIFELTSIATYLSLMSGAIELYFNSIQETLIIKYWMFLSTLLGLLVTFYCIYFGSGLYALPYGMLIRGILSLLGGIILTVNSLKKFGYLYFRFSKKHFFDLIKNGLASAFSIGSYGTLTSSDNFLVLTLFSPEIAIIYNMTKKGSDFVRMILDSITTSSIGSFSHLTGERNSKNILKGRKEILNVHLLLGLGLLVAYLMWNSQLVTLWVGNQYYAGFNLTLFLALATFVSTRSHLDNCLYRCSGSVINGSIVATSELLLRFMLVFIFIHYFGIIGLPLSILVISLIFNFLTNSLIKKKFGLLYYRSNNSVKFNLVFAIILFVMFAFISIYFFLFLNSWFSLIVGGLLTCFAVSVPIVVTNKYLDRYRIKIHALVEKAPFLSRNF